MDNPYQPPATPSHDPRPAAFFRPSLFVGVYLILLAAMACTASVVEAVTSGQIIKLSQGAVPLWIGYNGCRLLKRNEDARILVFKLSRFTAIALGVTFTLIFVFHPQSHISLLWYRIAEPTAVQVAGWIASIVILAALPALILMSSRAKREFDTSERPND